MDLAESSCILQSVRSDHQFALATTSMSNQHPSTSSSSSSSGQVSPAEDAVGSRRFLAEPEHEHPGTNWRGVGLGGKVNRYFAAAGSSFSSHKSQFDFSVPVAGIIPYSASFSSDITVTPNSPDHCSVVECEVTSHDDGDIMYPNGVDSNVIRRTCDRIVHFCTRGRRSIYRIPWATVEKDDALINKKLPKELLLRVFSCLDITTLCKCAQVCKLWNIYALDGSNWQRVDLFEFQVNVRQPVVERLAIRCGGFLKALNLMGCEDILDGSVRIFAERCTSIEYVNVEMCNKLTDDACRSLGCYSKKLKRLILSSCTELTDQSLKYISDGCPLLQWLNISWCTNLTSDGIIAIANGCHRLERLYAISLPITDDAMRHIAENCHDLRKINVMRCALLTDQAFRYLAEGCNKLDYVNISYCNLTDISLHALAHGCIALRDLECVSCSSLTDNGFNVLARNCHDLQRLDLEECSQITDETLKQLSGGCHDLVNLNLSNCENITDDGIKILAANLSVHDRLKELALDNCPSISDAALEYLKELRSMEKLDLYDCQNVSKQGIKRLGNNLSGLKIHAYFAPNTPPPQSARQHRRTCPCCTIL